MIDLEKERKLFQDFLTKNYDFENHEQTYFDEKTQCYVNDCGEDTELLNVAWETHKKCAESKQDEIDSLKAQLSKLNDAVQHLKIESSGVHAALRKQQRINENLSEKLFGVDAGNYVIVPKSPTNKMIGNAQGCGENFLFHYQVRGVWDSMIETAQEQNND